MVRVKFFVPSSGKVIVDDVKAFSFFVRMPARPIKGDTFMFNETIEGLEELGPEILTFLHDWEYGIQASSWHFDEEGPYLELTIEVVL